MSKRVEQLIAGLNGLVGDHLERSGNPLATRMGFARDGAVRALDEAEVAALVGDGASRVVLLVHGLMGEESVWAMPDGSDYGRRLERELGYAPLYLRYNSGRPIADNGAELDRLLGELVRLRRRPIERLLVVGHSMGGLVLRAACHAASVSGSDWLGLVERAIYLGTPHLGAPAERVGRVLGHLVGRIPDPVTRLVADIAALRSEGIRDLGDADLRHVDRARRRPSLGLGDPAHPVPLLEGLRHLLVVGTISEDPRIAALFGDAIVPVHSASFGGAEGSAACERVTVAGVDHVSLTRDERVYAAIVSWMRGST